MKTFAKLFAVLAVLAIGFTSCGDDNEGDVTIKLDYTTVDLGGAITGSIVSTNDLTSVTLTSDGKTVTGWPITSFKTGAVIGSDGVYAIRIEGLDAGSYTIRATDKDGVEDSKNFTIKGDVGPVYETFTVKLGGSTATAGSFLSIKDKKVYTTSEVNAMGTNNNVEIIFTGTGYSSAAESINANVNGNGHWATFSGEPGSTVASFTTSTGYIGTITPTSASGDGTSTEVIVEVARLAIEE